MRKMLWREVVPGNEAFQASRRAREGIAITPEHTHVFAEVFWISGGEGLHRLNGENFFLVFPHISLARGIELL